MSAVARIGDANTGGGLVVLSDPPLQSSVYANGILIAVDGCAVSDHGNNAHNAPITANGNTSVCIEGIPLNRFGDADSCGHTRVGGSPDVATN